MARNFVPAGFEEDGFDQFDGELMFDGEESDEDDEPYVVRNSYPAETSKVA